MALQICRAVLFLSYKSPLSEFLEAADILYILSCRLYDFSIWDPIYCFITDRTAHLDWMTYFLCLEPSVDVD